jgi:hypothetical protein
MVYRCRMLWKPYWLSVSLILNKSQIVSPANHPHTFTPPPPCFPVGTTHAEIIRSPTLRLTKTRWLEPNISHLNSSDQKTDFHRSNVHCSWLIDFYWLLTRHTCSLKCIPPHEAGWENAKSVQRCHQGKGWLLCLTLFWLLHDSICVISCLHYYSTM